MLDEWHSRENLWKDCLWFGWFVQGCMSLQVSTEANTYLDNGPNMWETFGISMKHDTHVVEYKRTALIVYSCINLGMYSADVSG